MVLDENMHYRLEMLSKVSSAFSPSAPINNFDLFAGRFEELKKIVNAINQRGQHVILYGERGVGKTSLAKILAQHYTESGQKDITAASVNCDGSDTFSSLWAKILGEFSFTVDKKSVGLLRHQQSEQLTLGELHKARTNTDDITPDDIRHILKPFAFTIIIIDEVDRLKDWGITAHLADTVKTLSDHSVNATLVLVGVADTVDQLIKEHLSIERAVVQIRMPRMHESELSEILERAFESTGMSITKDAKRRITWLSRGLPHYTHLLGLHAGQNAISDSRMNVLEDDIHAAIKEAVENVQQSIRSNYIKATTSPQTKHLYCQVLLACALAKTDELGYFSAKDVSEPMSQIMNREYTIPSFSRHLGVFSSNQRGPILEKTGQKRKYRFRFINPIMQPYVIFRGLSEGMITDDLVEQFIS